MKYIMKNPDREYVKLMQRKLKENNGFCPCSLEKNEDTKCMCRAFREQFERGEIGACHCALYFVEEKDGEE